MQRTIVISNIAGENGVRQIVVTVTYTTGTFNRTYTLDQLHLAVLVERRPPGPG